MTVGFEQLSCRELVELVTDYLEGMLPAAEHERVDRHLDTCRAAAPTSSRCARRSS